MSIGTYLESGLESGFQEGREQREAEKARKQALSDQEFQQRATELGTQLGNLRNRLETVPQGSREHGDLVGEIQHRIGELREMYHPENHPTAIARFGHLLTDAMRLTSPQKRIEQAGKARADASAEDERRALEMVKAAPLSPSELAKQAAQTATEQAELEQNWKLDWAKRHGVDAKAMAELTEHVAGVPTAKTETESAKTRDDFAAYQQEHPDYKGTILQWKAAQTAQGRAEVPKKPSNDDNFLSIQQKRAKGVTLTEDEQAFEKGYKALIKAKAIDPKVAGYSALAGSRIGEFVDPSNPLETIITSASDAMRRSLHGKGSIDFRIQMPTAQERDRADLAVSAREQLNTMSDILTRRSDLFGPASGRHTNFTEWIGSQDPDAQRFKAAAEIAADHMAGVFGGRGKYALQAIFDIIGKNATNPAAAMAGLEQMNTAAATIQARGTAGGAGGPSAPGGNPTPGDLKNQAKKNLGAVGKDPLGVL